MKPMLDDEYRRFRLGVWSLNKILLLVPSGLVVVVLSDSSNTDLVLVLFAVVLQNFLIYRITMRMRD